LQWYDCQYVLVCATHVPRDVIRNLDCHFGFTYSVELGFAFEA